MDSTSSENRAPIKVAGVDIGTNTILMLIANYHLDGTIEVLHDYHSIPRLGEGLNRSGIISVDSIARAKSVLKEYKTHIEREGVKFVFAVATEALRKAGNREDVLRELRDVLDYPIEVISGEMEASYTFLGTVNDSQPSVVIDVGGGSTEVVFGQNFEIGFRHSFPIGAVKLTEKLFSGQPPKENELEYAMTELNSVFSVAELPKNLTQAYAVAGTPTTLAQISLGLKQYDRNLVDGYILSLQELERIIETLKNMTPKEIVEKLYVPTGRADVLLAGALILLVLCKRMGIENLIVSDKGLRFGVIKERMKSLNFAFP